MLSLMEQSWNAFFQNIWIGFSLAEFAIPIALLLWGALFLLKLDSIDCTDIVTALLYTAFAAISGVILVVVVPAVYTKQDDLRSAGIWTVCFLVVALLRWMKAFDKQRKTIVKEKEKHGEAKEKSMG